LCPFSMAHFGGKVKGFHPAVTKRNMAPGVVVRVYYRRVYDTVIPFSKTTSTDRWES
jgi:hypothetical protein